MHNDRVANMLLSPLQGAFDVLLLQAFVVLLMVLNTKEMLGTGSLWEEVAPVRSMADTGTMEFLYGLPWA